MAEVERAITLLNGPGFPREVHRAMPPFGASEAKARLTAVLDDVEATDERRAVAEGLQERLQEKFGG